MDQISTAADRILRALICARLGPTLPRFRSGYSSADPQYFGPVGQIGLREELLIPSRLGLSLGAQEMEEFGSVAVRFMTPMDDPNPNTIPLSEALVAGRRVLIRGQNGGFYETRLLRDHQGRRWFVRINPNPTRSPTHTQIDVVQDHVRGLWVVRELV